MEFVKRDDSQPAKQMVEIFINHELKSIPKESNGKMFDLTPYVGTLSTDGAIYFVMDSICRDLTESGWHCYYKHYYTFVSRCYLFVSPNTILPDPRKDFKYFVPYSHEWDLKGNKFFPEKK